jgi:hypothetical protein
MAETSCLKCLWAYNKFSTEIQDVKHAIDRIGKERTSMIQGISLDKYDIESSGTLEELKNAQMGAERINRVCPIDEEVKKALSSLESDMTKVLTGERGAEILTTLEMGKQTLSAELDMYLDIIIGDITEKLMESGETSF